MSSFNIHINYYICGLAIPFSQFDMVTFRGVEMARARGASESEIGRVSECIAEGVVREAERAGIILMSLKII